MIWDSQKISRYLATFGYWVNLETTLLVHPNVLPLNIKN